MVALSTARSLNRVLMAAKRADDSVRFSTPPNLSLAGWFLRIVLPNPTAISLARQLQSSTTGSS
jgi:hypothetical protein